MASGTLAFSREVMDTLSKEIDRRSLVKGGFTAGLATLAGGLLIGCGGSAGLSGGTTSTSTTSGGGGGGTTSVDLFNFALNLEYLEAEFYLRALSGQGLSESDIGTNPGAVTGGSAVGFSTPLLRTVIQELASEELLHVRTLRSLLGSSAVARPAINFTAAFASIASLTGITGFDPFADEQSLFLGAFFLEDLGVTAYNGALASLTTSTEVQSAAGLMGAECYHSGVVRRVLYEMAGTAQSNAGRLSSLRASLGNGKDQALANGTLANLSQTDTTTGLVFSRTTREVLNVLYLSANAATGGFFPNGLNGNIKS